MARLTTRMPWYWERFDPRERHAGAETAKLRRGLDQSAGSVPELWAYYVVTVPDRVAAYGRVTRELAAEHAALTLFGLHQQSQDRTMHLKGEHLGSALNKLRRSDQFSANPEALDRRVAAAATATSTRELVFHLRGLVTLLRGEKLPFDYTSLVHDLADWEAPEGQARVRRRWGANYFAWAKAADNVATPGAAADAVLSSAEERTTDV
jgi:CRISPR system Cascade subunit CasB